jgi:two-component system, NarL family, invasion response regulator UvrY
MTARSQAKIRVLLADDHAVVRLGYRLFLEHTDQISVVAEADSADNAYQAFRESAPDVVVMDISMPGSSGIDAMRRILAIDAQARVLIFTMHAHAVFARQALSHGAIGFITKDSSPEFLVNAVLNAARGRRTLSTRIAEDLAFSVAQPDKSRLDALSPRQFEICRLFVSGYSINDIAEQMKISPKTVANQLSIARAKLDVDSDVALFRLAISAGLVSVDRQITPDL